MSLKDLLTTKNIIFLILILVILKSLSMITVIALLFFASFIIACSLNPVVDWFSKKINRSGAAALVLFGTLTITSCFFLPIIVVAVKQVHGLLLILPEKIDVIQHFIFHHQFHGHRIPEIINIDSIIKTSTSPFATGLVNQSINFTLSFAQGILFFLAICMIVFYLMADKDTVKNSIMKLFPSEMKEKASDIYDNISHKVGGYVIAQILYMIVVGLMTAIGMFLIKVDYALLLGLITGTLDIIPLVGPTVALILCLIMANQMGIVGVALAFAVFIAVQWITNNLIRPIIFGKFLDLHPLIIIFALLVAAQFLGVWGVILAPAIASLVCVLFDEIYIKTINNGDK